MCNKTSQLTIYAVLSPNVAIFYWQELASLFQVQENWKRKGIQNQTFRVAILLQMTVM